MAMLATPVEADRTEKVDDKVNEITPYQVIKLLLDGAIKTIDNAMVCLNEGSIDEAFQHIKKTIAIVNRLRESLNMKVEGDIAENLDMLYEYIVIRLESIGYEVESQSVLSEVSKLLHEVHMGWSGIASQI